MPTPWQLCFDDGHQQRYLPDRAAVLRYVLAIGPKAASKRFEVFAESDPIQLADGTSGGRSFSLVEVIDLSRPGETERLRSELADVERECVHKGLPSGPESHTFGAGGRTIIPLMPGVARPRGERRAAMQQAVVEVVRHLVLKAVPPEHRSPLFGQARDLLTEAGWGLDELFEAAEDGPARSALFKALGLET
jgi:hypothetical protein